MLFPAEDIFQALISSGEGCPPPHQNHQLQQMLNWQKLWLPLPNNCFLQLNQWKPNKCVLGLESTLQLLSFRDKAYLLMILTIVSRMSLSLVDVDYNVVMVGCTEYDRLDLEVLANLGRAVFFFFFPELMGCHWYYFSLLFQAKAILLWFAAKLDLITTSKSIFKHPLPEGVPFGLMLNYQWVLPLWAIWFLINHKGSKKNGSFKDKSSQLITDQHR